MTIISFSPFHFWDVGYPHCCSQALGKHGRGGIGPSPQGNTASSSGISYPVIRITPVPCLAAGGKRCSKVNFIYIILMLN